MIQINNLAFWYSNRGKLFYNLSLELIPNNIYGLLGKNGAGKSTLLKLMTGLLYPKSGECLLFGKTASDRLPHILHDICFLPEEFNLPAVSSEKFVAANSPFYKKFSNEQFKIYMDEFEIDRKQRLSFMSYGQKKKFLISYGLATNAAFMVMDEPTNGLDIPSKSQFRKLMASTIQDDRCYIISTHQVRDLENLIDPILIIDKGRIVFNETLEKITSKLTFGDIEGRESTDVLFSEGLEGRKRGVALNKNGQPSSIDLEMLFNAVILENKKISNLLNN